MKKRVVLLLFAGVLVILFLTAGHSSEFKSTLNLIWPNQATNTQTAGESNQNWGAG